MINVEALSKSFHADRGGVAAVESATLNVGENEIVALLGPSGSGKTTLLRCVAGLDQADRGTIAIGGRTVFSSERGVNVPTERRRIGMVFQSYAIWPHLTVGENVALPLRHGCMSILRSEVETRVRQVLRAVQLSGYENRQAPNLSGGQQQRVALARALAVQPEAMLMDEPLSNLDARMREEVRREIRTLVKASGVPVLYVTHDQTEAMDLADRIVVIERGRVLQIGCPEEVYERPASHAVASFMGSMNWLSGKALGDGRVETASGFLWAACGAEGSFKVEIGVRPERMAISDQDTGESNQFRGVCVEASFMGDHCLYRVRVADAILVVKTIGRLERAWIGHEVYLSLPRESLVVFPQSETCAGPQARSNERARVGA